MPVSYFCNDLLAELCITTPASCETPDLEEPIKERHYNQYGPIIRVSDNIIQSRITSLG